MDSQYADRDPPVARPQGPCCRAQGRGLSRRQALLAACAARAGVGAHRPVVQGRQPHVLRRLHGDASRLIDGATPIWAACYCSGVVMLTLATETGVGKFE